MGLRLSRYDWAFCWLLVALVAIFLHGPVPLYSTRTLGVAWEMWARGDFLLPVQNGLPYSHKPPTIYWLIHAGWAAFGVSDVWPRVLMVLLGGTAGYLTMRLATTLYPNDDVAPRMAPWILLSGLYFFLFSQQIMFEMLLVIAVLCAWLSALRIWHGKRFGVAALAASIALGLLTKGPVMLLHVLPGLLLLPWVARQTGEVAVPRWRRKVLLAALGGALIALAWAVPTALSVGAAFAQQLLIGQTTGRVTQAFDHARPLWWYLPWLLVLGFPWVFQWQPLKALRTAVTAPRFSTRLLLVWVVPTFIGFCLVSGKQVYYLLPLMPAFSIALARGLAERQRSARPWIVAVMLAALGGALIGFHFGVITAGENRAWHAALVLHSGLGGGALLACAAALLLPADNALARTRITAAVTLLALLALKALFAFSVWPGFNLAPTAAKLRALGGAPVASIEYYEGQYHFAARLTQPIAQLARDPERVAAWTAQHPDGYLLVYPSQPTVCATPPLHLQPFRNQYLELWPVGDWRRCGAPSG